MERVTKEDDADETTQRRIYLLFSQLLVLLFFTNKNAQIFSK